MSLCFFIFNVMLSASGLARSSSESTSGSPTLVSRKESLAEISRMSSLVKDLFIQNNKQQYLAIYETSSDRLCAHPIIELFILAVCILEGKERLELRVMLRKNLCHLKNYYKGIVTYRDEYVKSDCRALDIIFLSMFYEKHLKTKELAREVIILDDLFFSITEGKLQFNGSLENKLAEKYAWDLKNRLRYFFYESIIFNLGGFAIDDDNKLSLLSKEFLNLGIDKKAIRTNIIAFFDSVISPLTVDVFKSLDYDVILANLTRYLDQVANLSLAELNFLRHSANLIGTYIFLAVFFKYDFLYAAINEKTIHNLLSLPMDLIEAFRIPNQQGIEITSKVWSILENLTQRELDFVEKFYLSKKEELDIVVCEMIEFMISLAKGSRDFYMNEEEQVSAEVRREQNVAKVRERASAARLNGQQNAINVRREEITSRINMEQNVAGVRKEEDVGGLSHKQRIAEISGEEEEMFEDAREELEFEQVRQGVKK